MQDLTGLTWNAALSIEGGNKSSGADSSGNQAVDGLVIAHNTIVNCARSISLNDKHGKRSPTGVVANNLIVTHNAKQKLLEAKLSIAGLKWQSNAFFGPGGAPQPVESKHTVVVNPHLKKTVNRYRPTEFSPVVDAASDGFEFIKTDIEQKPRPPVAKGIGADEWVEIPDGLFRSLPLNVGQVWRSLSKTR